MAGTISCHTCGQANASDSEYCVRCGERMPDPEGTQLVSQPGATQPEYPWEPPAEWDPGELPPTAGQQPTWVSGQQAPSYQPPATPAGGYGPASNPAGSFPGISPNSTPGGAPGNQVGWNTGNDTGANSGWGGQPPSQGGSGSGSSKKPIFIGLGAVVLIAAIVVGVVLATGGKKKNGGHTNVNNNNVTALNGVQNENGTDALTSARTALRNASTVHLAGIVRDNNQNIQLDLELVGNNSQGTLTVNNADVQLIKLDSSVFIKGDPDFLKQYAGTTNTAVLSQINGKWLKAASTSDFNQFNIDGFANLLKGGSNGATVNPTVTRSTLNGKPIVIVSLSDGSTLSIANTGTPFPLALDSKGSSGGSVTFTDYNKNVTVTAPPASEVVDLTKTVTPTPTPAAKPTVNQDLVGTLDCTFPNGNTAGSLTLNTNLTYTVSGGTPGGFWGSSGNAVAFVQGTLDKYTGTYDGQDTITLHGAGTNASVTLNCIYR